MKNEQHLQIAKSITKLLEGQFSIGGVKFGLDAIVGFVPVIGDIVPAALSGYLVWIAYHMELPANKIAQMISNIVLDFIIGTIPLVGDITDFFFKSNIKNLAILEEYLSSNNIVKGELVE